MPKEQKNGYFRTKIIKLTADGSLINYSCLPCSKGAFIAT